MKTGRTIQELKPLCLLLKKMGNDIHVLYQGKQSNCANDDEILDKAKEHFEDIIDEIGDKCGKRLFEEDGSILLRTTDW